VVEPPEVFESEFADWGANCEYYGATEVGPFRLPVAPDIYHKDNVSGGPPYSLILPNSAVDGYLQEEWHQTTFVDYLRIVFQSGGFPGFEQGPQPLPPKLVALRHDLLPI